MSMVLPPPIIDSGDFARATGLASSPPTSQRVELADLVRRRTRQRERQDDGSEPGTPDEFMPVEPPPDMDPDLNPHIDAVKRANRRARKTRRREAAGRSVVSGVSGTTSKKGKGPASVLRAAIRKVTGRRGSDDGGSSTSSTTSRGRTTTRGRRSPSRSPSRSSTSSSSSARTTSSSSSASTWWRFWRDSSSTTSKDTARTGWLPPLAPEFTLMTPSMPSHYAQLFGGSLLARLDAKDPALPVFDLFTSPDVDSALQRLLAFWHERGQDDAVDGDLGVVSSEKREYVAPVVDVDSFDARSRLGRPPPRRAETSRLKIRKQPLSPSHRVAFTRQGTLADPPPPFSSNPNSPPESPPRQKGPAWWLDVLCPTAADMHRLRKIFPLHPLTIEDILHQDMREKLEVFDALGYYLVSFRALDEGYFRYTDQAEEDDPPTTVKEDVFRDDGTKASAASVKSARTVRSGTQKPRRPGTLARRRRAKVEIIEPLGFRGAVEGAGAGAVNMYLVVFGDGIISFHFQDMQRHVDRVRSRIQQLGSHVHVSPHWIAYGLMNSIVDAFFPVIDFIETESDELAAYLADPMSPSTERGSRRRIRQTFLPTFGWVRSLWKSAPPAPPPPAGTLLTDATDPHFDRGAVLRRITMNRKLVTAMTRLLAQKSQVVQNLRKRMRVSERPTAHRDIGIYLSDLHDHIVAMMQNLGFYDALLSHDHPLYLRVLRVAMTQTKCQTDVQIIRLFFVYLSTYGFQIVMGLFSMNVDIPHNGQLASPHQEPDGSVAPFAWFGIVLVLTLVAGSAVLGTGLWIIRHSERTAGRKIHIWSIPSH